MTKITLKLTFEELKTLDKYVELNDETRPLFDKIKNAYPKPETLLDVIRNLGYSYDMCDEIVDAVEEFEKSKEKEMIKRNLKTSLQELANGDVRPIDDVVRETKNQQEEPKPMDDAIDRLLEKYKSQKLWNMVRNELGYSIDCCDEIVDLVERWLPKEQCAEGSQNTFAIDATEGFNHCLRKMKGMLR